MKKNLFAGLVMICLSVTTSAQKASEKSTEKNRIEKTFKKGEYAKKHGDRKKHNRKFKKGNTKRFSHNGRNRS